MFAAISNRPPHQRLTARGTGASQIRSV